MRRALILLAAVALAAPATASADALDIALKRLVGAKGGPPGAISLIQKGDGAPDVRRTGVRNIRTRRPMGATDAMRLASTSKAFTGAASLALVQQGRLSLADTVASRTTGLPAAWGPVTLGQLLDHTSGIPSFTKNEAWLTNLGKQPLKAFTLQQVAEIPAGDPMEFPPGTSYEYSNTDNIIIALMVENATGQPWRAALQSLVLDPLALSGTREPTSNAFPRGGIQGYFMQPPDAPENVSQAINMTAIGPSGDLISTPANLNAFMRGYNGGRLFSGATRQAQLQVRPGNSEPRGPGTNQAGLGIFEYTTKCGVVYGHTGNFPGYTQFAAATADGTTSMTLSANTQLDVTAPGKFAAKVFPKFRAAAEAAVCEALQG